MTHVAQAQRQQRQARAVRAARPGGDAVAGVAGNITRRAMLYVHLKRRWSFKQRNNGRLFLSQRDAQEEMGGSQRDSISRWFRELQHYGFIVMTTAGCLGVDGKGKAPHWRLTELEAPGGRNGSTLMLPTKDFLKWDGTKFHDDRGRCKASHEKQNPGPQTRARVA